MFGHGNQDSAVRPRSAIEIVSTQRTTPQVHQVPHAKVFGDFPRFDAAGRKVTTQQTLAAELAHPVLRALGAKTQPLDDPGQFRRD
jgi:hypothetical protein